MKKITQLLLVAIIAFVAYSCGDSTIIKKKVTGKAGEMVVVLPKALWKDSVGVCIRKHLAQEQVSLPQAEPLFDLINVPPEAFAEIFQTNRSIILTNINANVDSTGVYFMKDLWSWPQCVIKINAKSEDEFIELFNQNSNSIISFMLKGEKDRIMYNYANYRADAITKDVMDQFGVDITIPYGFTKATSKKDFYWTRYDTPLITQNVMIYSIPYSNDSIFTKDYLISYRDSLLKAYVQGPTDGSYMTSEHRVPASFQAFEHNGNYATELRGLWRLEGDFMGGPYLSIAVLSPDHSRVIVADASLYAPQKEKRNYVRQLEAMIYSLKFPEQDTE